MIQNRIPVHKMKEIEYFSIPEAWISTNHKTNRSIKSIHHTLICFRPIQPNISQSHNLVTPLVQNLQIRAQQKNHTNTVHMQIIRTPSPQAQNTPPPSPTIPSQNWRELTLPHSTSPQGDHRGRRGQRARGERGRGAGGAGIATTASAGMRRCRTSHRARTATRTRAKTGAGVCARTRFEIGPCACVSAMTVAYRLHCCVSVL